MATPSKKVIDLRKKQPGASFTPRTSARPPEKRVSTLRQKRQRTRRIMFVMCIAICVLGAYGVHALSYAPQYSIQTLSVEGVHMISPVDVRMAMEKHLDALPRKFLSPRNIFLYDKDALETAIETAIPRVTEVHVSRPSLFSTALTVTIRERTSYALWCDDAQQCFELDETGFVFAPTQASSTIFTIDAPTRSYVFTGGLVASTTPVGSYLAQAHFPWIVRALALLGQAGFSARDVHIENDSDILIILARGFAIRTSFGQTAEGMTRNLSLILSSDALVGKESEIDYIDLRWGDRVYFKLKNDGAGRSNATSTRQ